jgi:hypothetical protein
MGIEDKIIAYALSTVFSGTSGITSFYTLFLMGLIERYDANLLNMGETMDAILASIPGLIVTGILSILELLGMCIPVVDEIVDAAMSCVVPFVSIVSTLATWGLYDINTNDEGERKLEEFGGATFLQIFAVVSGIFIALSTHFIKMLIRIIGEGWLTNILSVLEIVLVTISVIICVYIKFVAIAFAVGLLLAITWYFKKGRHRRREKAQQQRPDAGERGEGADFQSFK